MTKQAQKPGIRGHGHAELPASDCLISAVRAGDLEEIIVSEILDDFGFGCRVPEYLTPIEARCLAERIVRRALRGSNLRTDQGGT